MSTAIQISVLGLIQFNSIVTNTHSVGYTNNSTLHTNLTKSIVTAHVDTTEIHQHTSYKQTQTYLHKYNWTEKLKSKQVYYMNVTAFDTQFSNLFTIQVILYITERSKQTTTNKV